MTQITVSGLIATTPRTLTTADGVVITSFRLAESNNRYNRTTNQWETSETNWFTIVAFGELAKNMEDSFYKGDRVFVEGSMQIRDWDNGERMGTNVEITAINAGHNIAWGTSQFNRTVLVRNHEDGFPSQPTTPTEPIQSHSCNCRSCNR